MIKKPRTNYSSNVLRRVLPNVNIQQKKESLTMMKLKVLTSLKLHKGEGSSGMLPRKVKTVQQIPKILSIISTQQNFDDFGKQMRSGIQAIAEEDVSKPGDDEDDDSDSSKSGGRDTPESEDDGSSMSGDSEDE